MKKYLAGLFVGLLVIGGIMVGCGEQARDTVQDILQVVGRTPALNASGVDHETDLVLTFNFPIAWNIGINDLFASYGSSHTAGTPDLSSATLEASSDRKTITVSGIKGWSNLTLGAGPKVVEVVAAADKIKDIFSNDISSGNVLWKFTLADENAPKVVSVSPTNGAIDVSADTQITATFSEDMDASTINTNTFTLSGSTVTGTVSYDVETKTATFTPQPALEHNHTFTATLSAGVKDASGNSLEIYTWSFTTIDQVSTPTFALSSGSYEANELAVTIECSTTGADIYYTLDGSAPNASSSQYTGSFTIEASKTVKAVAVKAGLVDSAVAEVWYDLWWWQALGAGLNGWVRALTIDNSGNLYAAGDFNKTGDGAINASHAAKWDGTAWSAVENRGLDWRARAVATDSSGDLYLGGDFIKTNDAAITLNYIAKLVGSDWSALANSGLNSTVFALAAANTDMYVGGDFTQTGDTAITLNNIAMWDGTSWSALANNGLNSDVRDLFYDGSGNLYVGGRFTTTGDTSITLNRIAKWDGSNWKSLGNNGLDWQVNALMDDGHGNLYVGGGFAKTGDASITLNRIAEWDGVSWSTLGNNGLNTWVNALAIDNSGDLYVGGNFTQTGDGSMILNYIAKWNGSNWSAIGNNDLGGGVNSLIVDDSGNLYVGGNFTNAGGIAEADYIAKWSKKL